MLTDRYDLPLSTPSVAARDAYVIGVDSVLSAVFGYREHLARAIELDPQFALAHVALARGLFMDADVVAAREFVAEARRLAAGTTPREQSHIEAICLALEGKPVDALRVTLAHLGEWPRDAMVLSPTTSVFGLYGFNGRVDHEEQLYQLLQSLAPAYGEDWWFDAVYGFAACETGRLDQACVLLDRSLARHPRNAHAAHYRVHAMYELGETDAALQFLTDWMPAFDRRSLMHCHMSWHVALGALTAGRHDLAWQAYRDGVHPGGSWGPPLNVVTDSVSFLWRAELAGQARTPSLWRDVQQYTLRSFPKAGVAFADVHNLLACVVQDDKESLARLLEEVRARVAGDRYPAGGVVVAITDGFSAYAAGDYEAAIGHLSDAWPDTVRIGGSRAQRDLVELTLIAALIKAGRMPEAVKWVAGQADRRPVISVAGYGGRPDAS